MLDTAQATVARLQADADRPPLVISVRILSCFNHRPLTQKAGPDVDHVRALGAAQRNALSADLEAARAEAAALRAARDDALSRGRDASALREKLVCLSPKLFFTPLGCCPAAGHRARPPAGHPRRGVAAGARRCPRGARRQGEVSYASAANSLQDALQAESEAALSRARMEHDDAIARSEAAQIELRKKLVLH